MVETGGAGRNMSGMVHRAFRMMLGTLASRILGLLREVLTAGFFGATRSLDAFYVSYTLANLARQLLAEGALSASFVPVFSRVLKRDGEKAAGGLARQVMAILIIACMVAVAAGILISPLLVRIIAPGFEAGQHALAVALTRAMFPFLLIVSVGALAMGVLNSLGSFFIPAVAPAASNFAYILILIAMRRHLSVWTLVAAVLAGGACNMLLQWSWSARLGTPLLPAKPDLSNPDLRETLSLFFPYAAGLSLNQINPIISRVLASFLEGGVISVLNYADRIIQLPLGLFVIAISQAVLPMLSRVDEADTEGFQFFIRDALRFNLFVVLPAALGLVLLARPIVHALLVRGAFGEWAWEATAGALACYALGLPGIACNTVIMRALYARSLPRAAVSVTLFTVVVNLAAGVFLMRFFSYRGLALGASCAFTGAAFLGGYLLSGNLGRKVGLFGAIWSVRQLAACCVLAGGLLLFGSALPYPAAAAALVRFAWILTVVIFSMLLYTAVTLSLRCPEWVWIREALGRKSAEAKGRTK